MTRRWTLTLPLAIILLLVALLPGQAAAGSAQTISRFATSEPIAVLTFDAGADRGYAAGILDTLAAKGVKATFGMTGQWASAHPDLIGRMVREGHHLMNHTWTHKSFTGYSTGTAPLTAAQRAEEITRTADLIRGQVGVELAPYFRPPYGDYDSATLDLLGQRGYAYNVMWTVDSLGWKGLTAAQITQRVVANTVPGAIILLHVGAASQDGPALPGIIDQLRGRGYRFATVRDFLGGAPPPAPSPSEIVVDNATAGRLTASGNWGASSWSGQRYGAGYRYATPQAVSDAAWFKAAIPATGAYEVFAWYPADSGYNSATPFVIEAAGGRVVVRVNQQINGGRWVSLGTHTLNAGDYNVVGVSRWSAASGYVIADAIKLARR